MKLISSDRLPKTNKVDKFWIHEDNILEELVTLELTPCKNQYKFSIELCTQAKWTRSIRLFFIFNVLYLKFLKLKCSISFYKSCSLSTFYII